jgi:hypothetical protein
MGAEVTAVNASHKEDMLRSIGADDVSRESMTLVSIHPRIAPHGDFTG